MKMTKKKIFVAALALCLIATISMGTLAWFSATDEIDNKFTILSSLTDSEVDVWEAVPDGTDTDEEPDVIGKGDTTTENGYTYTNVIPGEEVYKTVYVENTSNSTLAGQYIKMEVTFTNYNVLHDMIMDLDAPDCATAMLLGANFSANKTESQMQWWFDANATRYADNSVTYVFYLKEVLTPGTALPLFTGVKIPTSMDINDADYLIKNGGFQIKAVAFAIQNANISDPNGTTALDHAVYAFANGYYGNDSSPAYPVQQPTTNP